MKERLILLLEAQHMRPSRLAREAGVGTSTIDDILKGKINEKNIGVTKALNIANALGVTVEYLYGLEAGPESSTEVENLDEARLLGYFRSLNATGQAKAIDYLADLIATGKY